MTGYKIFRTGIARKLTENGKYKPSTPISMVNVIEESSKDLDKSSTKLNDLNLPGFLKEAISAYLLAIKDIGLHLKWYLKGRNDKRTIESLYR